MWGSTYWGQTYWAGFPLQSEPDTRTNCGGVWGTATWGQTYWGGHIQCGGFPPPDTRPNCGGVWGTATWAQAYWGGHIQCPMPVPPIPPVPVPHGGGIGSGIGVRGRHDSWNRRLTQHEIERYQAENRYDAERALQEELARLAKLKQDDEDLMLILSLWMNTK